LTGLSAIAELHAFQLDCLRHFQEPFLYLPVILDDTQFALEVFLEFLDLSSLSACYFLLEPFSQRLKLGNHGLILM
jgi:hypothetical protein